MKFIEKRKSNGKKERRKEPRLKLKEDTNSQLQKIFRRINGIFIWPRWCSGNTRACGALVPGSNPGRGPSEKSIYLKELIKNRREKNES